MLLSLLIISNYKSILSTQNHSKEILKINNISSETIYIRPLINIYTANIQELQQIKYIGKKTAQRIYNSKSLTGIHNSKKISQYIKH